jgi:hypothetical protein
LARCVATRSVQRAVRHYLDDTTNHRGAVPEGFAGAGGGAAAFDVENVAPVTVVLADAFAGMCELTGSMHIVIRRQPPWPVSRSWWKAASHDGATPPPIRPTWATSSGLDDEEGPAEGAGDRLRAGVR